MIQRGENRRALRALLVLPALICCSAAPRGGKPDTIVVRVKPVGVICLGRCSNYVVTVTSRGVVTVQSRPSDSGDYSWRYTVSRAEYVYFDEALSRIRPHGVQRDEKDCQQSLEGADFRPDIEQYDVEWRDAEPARLIGCNWDGPVRAQLREALATIHIEPTSGTPFKAIHRFD